MLDLDAAGNCCAGQVDGCGVCNGNGIARDRDNECCMVRHIVDSFCAASYACMRIPLMCTAPRDCASSVALLLSVPGIVLSRLTASVLVLQEGSFLDGALNCCPSGTPLDECGFCNGDASSCASVVLLSFTLNSSVVASVSDASVWAEEAVAALRSNLDQSALSSYPASSVNITSSVDWWEPERLKVPFFIVAI